MALGISSGETNARRKPNGAIKLFIMYVIVHKQDMLGKVKSLLCILFIAVGKCDYYDVG